MENIFLSGFMSAYDTINQNKKRYKIKYLVTSHKSYYQIALPLLLQSMVEQIPVEDILVVVGGMDEERHFRHFGIEVKYVTYNDCDHSGFTCLAKNWELYKNQCDYWFNLHDTCQCGPYFSELVYNFPPEVETYAAWSNASSNLGLYKSSYIEKIIPIILEQHEGFKHLTPAQGALKYEDTLWVYNNGKKLAYNNMESINNAGMGDKLIQVGGEPVGYKDAYKNGSKHRRAICYRKLNLYKFKSAGVPIQGF